MMPKAWVQFPAVAKCFKGFFPVRALKKLENSTLRESFSFVLHDVNDLNRGKVCDVLKPELGSLSLHKLNQ